MAMLWLDMRMHQYCVRQVVLTERQRLLLYLCYLCPLCLSVNKTRTPSPKLSSKPVPTIRDIANAAYLDLPGISRPIPALAEAKVRDLRPLVEAWHQVALPFIGTKEFDETWADFGTAWENVKFPMGKGPIETLFKEAMQKPLPVAANAYGTESLKKLVALCCELQHNAGAAPFYLTCRTAGQLLGISHVVANKWLHLLERDELLEITERGSQKRATRYRYLGNQQAGAC